MVMSTGSRYSAGLFRQARESLITRVPFDLSGPAKHIALGSVFGSGAASLAGRFRSWIPPDYYDRSKKSNDRKWIIENAAHRKWSIDLEQRAKNAVSFNQAQELLKLSIAELEDAIDVLACGDLHPEAVTKLREAQGLDLLALITSHKPTRNALIDQAISRKTQARGMPKN